MKNQKERKGFDQIAVKAMASLARGVAQDSVSTRCFAFFHQPQEPKDLAKRLEAMNKK